MAGDLRHERGGLLAEALGHAMTGGAVAFDLEHDLADGDSGARRQFLQPGEIDGDLLPQIAGAIAEGIQLVECDEKRLPGSLAEASIVHEAFAGHGLERVDGLEPPGARLPVEGNDLSGFHTTRKDTASDHGELSGSAIVFSFLSLFRSDTMKKLMVLSGLVLGILALTVGATAQAAGPKTGGQGTGKGQVNGQAGPKPGARFAPGKGSQRILDQLNLTAAQKQKVEALQNKMRESMKSMVQSNPKGNDKAARDKNMAKFKSIREQFEKDLLAILTKDQQAKYKKLIEDMKAKRAAGPPPTVKKGGK